MRESVLNPEENLPLLLAAEPGNRTVTPGELLGANGDLERKLDHHGTILFRNFGIDTPGAFRRFVGAFAGKLLDYVDGNSPRTKLASGVYTSTDYPPQYFISLHNELSYSHRWPGRLFFCCITPPLAGGETVIANSRAILRDLSPELVDEFTRKQVKYIRNLHGGNGFGPSWQDTFETGDRRAVERFCQESGMESEWRENGSLRISHVRPAVLRHPRTGEKLWFNQADQFHPSTHPPEVYEALMAMYDQREDELPQNVRFGDDSAIDVRMLEEVREVVRRHTVYFPWQQGDVLMVDNMLVCHGRAPYEGPRKILVSMCDVRSWEN